MLFFCTWADKASFIVDADTIEFATAAATEEEGGIAPSKVVPIPPGLFAVRVHFDDEDEDDEGETVVLDPLDHVVELLFALEDEHTPDDAPEDVATVEEFTLPASRCTSEAETDALEIVRCELPLAHGDMHKNGDLRW